ncbi:unnamed protein product [Dovyalis caffra]|uniref:Rho termination factor-like N-terminal domain-containing protein n=1 Tax=Dovyalis caffra TaxID=77055 RepID=A0AAV1SJF4_9ROSI|nr:unnamed protein product [Dovyalis caffra]
MVSATVFYPQNTFFNKPSCASFSKQQPKLGNPSYSLKDGSLAFASQNGVLQLSVSSIKSDGSSRGRPPRKSSAPGRTEKEDENLKSLSSDRKIPLSSNQEEIMALFRRIQSSISKGESTATKKNNAGRSKEKSPPDSILEALRYSRKHTKDTRTVREGKKVPTQKRSVPKDQKTKEQNALADFKLTRPPSNFTKKSPIPSPATPGEKTTELNSEPSKAKACSNISELPRVAEMKLAELKELAKSRGIKGYSKLKKGELLELLRS